MTFSREPSDGIVPHVDESPASSMLPNSMTTPLQATGSNHRKVFPNVSFISMSPSKISAKTEKTHVLGATVTS